MQPPQWPTDDSSSPIHGLSPPLEQSTMEEEYVIAVQGVINKLYKFQSALIMHMALNNSKSRLIFMPKSQYSWHTRWHLLIAST
jgi:hypothetical protein